MRNLTDFAIKQEYERVKELGDKLVDVGNRIDWEAYRPKLEQLFDNKSDRGGRPNIDVIVMLKSLYIQHLYSLSDEQLERELADRSPFGCFWTQRRSFLIPPPYGNLKNVWPIGAKILKSGMICRDNLTP